MVNFFEFLANNELTIVVCLMIAIFILIMAIVIIDLLSKRNNKQAYHDQTSVNERDTILPQYEDTENTTELGMIANADVLNELDVDKVTKSLEKTAEIAEIKYVDEDEELEKTKALLELQTLKEELAKFEQQEELEQKEEINSTVQNKVLVEENDLPQEDITNEIEIEEESSIEEQIEHFEDEQEEKAIISVEELTKAQQNISDVEIEEYEDDGNEPISLKELEAMYESIEEKPIKEEVVQEMVMPDFDIKINPTIDVYEEKQFRTTPVISPVYGIKPNESSIALEQTANLEKLNEEIRKTNEFLNALKELRKNLE